jgi:predicted PurR-regulated permease PerM
MKSKRTTIIFLLVLLLIAATLAFAITYSFLRAVAFAIILAVVFYPLHQHILRWTKQRAGWASLLSTLTLLILFGIPVVIILLMAANEAFTAAHYLSRRSAEPGGLTGLAMSLAAQPMHFIGRWIDLTKFDLNTIIRSNMQKVSVWTLSFGAAVLGNFARFLGTFLITLVVVFFLFRDGKDWVYRASKLTPLSSTQTDRLLQNIADTIIANVYGIISVGVVQGLLVGISLRIVGIPSALLLAVAASFASIIPVIGCALVWAPAGIYLLVTGSIGKGIFVLIWGIAVVSSADNFIRPWVISGKVQLHPLVLLFFILGGVEAFGFLGIFLGPIVASVLAVLFKMLREELGERAPEPPAAGQAALP